MAPLLIFHFFCSILESLFLWVGQTGGGRTGRERGREKGRRTNQNNQQHVQLPCSQKLISMLPKEVKEDYVVEIMGQNVTNRLIIFQMRIRMCACGCAWAYVCMCAAFVHNSTCLRTVSDREKAGIKGERARGVATERQLASGSPFNPQMTYLDSFMFAWRRIKKALHFPFYRLGTHVSATLPESALI